MHGISSVKVGVSIPRRYAKNCLTSFLSHLYVMFQFLVGTLKTRPIVEHQFPCLRFQFLVGTLKTWLSRAAIHWRSLVSIPRRYAKNLEKEEWGGTGRSYVSIPRRYAKNFRQAFYLPSPTGVSIPRRYAKNLLHPLKMARQWYVSIPRRYAKNVVWSIWRNTGLPFQFLVGTLKTFARFNFLKATTRFNSS